MTAMGDLRVVNDNGRLTCIEESTHLEHEAWGQVDDQDPKATVQDFKVSDAAEYSRKRFSRYVGFLGDFLHQFYTDPVALVGALAQDRAGKLRMWQGGDGTFLVSSIADIVLERVTRIPVPVQNLEMHDPEGNSTPTAQFLDTWRYDPEQPWRSAFQLRDYARWLNQYHAYAPFLRMDKDWTVKSEAESASPIYQNQDKQAAQQVSQQDQTPRDVYACYRIMRDGSIVSLDGYGGCVMQAGGSIAVSAPKDLRLEAGRNIIMVAGQDVFCKARRHVEIVSVVGALIMKARTRLSIMCERGTILIRTLMKSGQPEETEPVTHRFNDHALGIVLDAPTASTLVSSGGTVSLDGGFDEEQDSKGVRIRSTKGDVDISTSENNSARIASGKFVLNSTLAHFVANKLLSIRTAYFDLSNSMVWKEGKLHVRGLFATALYGKIIQHGTQMVGRMLPEMTRGAPPHTNHVGYTDDDALFEFPAAHDEQQTIQDEVPKAQKTFGNILARAARVVSEYLPRQAYGDEALDQTLAQQIAEQSAQHPAGAQFDTWDFSQDGEEGDELASHQLPWPGLGAYMTRYQSTGSPLHEKSSEPAADHKPNRAPAPAKTPWNFQRYRS